MELINKDEIYILRQPDKLILSIIVVDIDLDKPVNDKAHSNLGWLTDFSDVFFIFNESHWSGQAFVGKEKFTSLYQGCGFISSDSKNLGKSLMRVFEYDKEILSEEKVHLGYTITNLSDLVELGITHFNHLTTSLPYISRPIYKERRLTSSEFFDIYKYKENDSSVEKSLSNQPGRKSIWRVMMEAWWKKRGNEKDRTGMYSNWHSNSPLIYLPKGIVGLILDTTSQDSFFNAWTETFITGDVRFFIASLIKHLGIEILNMEVLEVKV